MKRVFLKVLSLMLIVIMLTTSIPLNSLAANDANGVINNSTVEIKDTNSFSKILADDVDMSKSTVDMPYYISKIEFNDNVATVEYYNQSTCRLLVVIYDENTEEMITSEVAEIGEESLETKITFEDSYPENFLAKGFLIDYDNAALCPAFVCRTYTTEFKEIQEKTVYDFDSEKVISFDNTDDNNFAVLSDEAIVINGSDERNTLVSADVDNNIYKIKNIDDSVKNLQSGDVVYFDNDDLLNLVTIKIKSITVNGTEATIVAEDSEMEDIFDFVKIDSSTSAGEGEYSAEGADEDVEYLGDVSYETGEAEISTQAVSGGSDFTPSKKWKIAEKEVKNKNGKANALFSATLIFGVNIVFSYYLSRNFKEVSFVASPFIKVSASASGTIETLSIKLGSLSFTPITGIFIGFEPRFTVKFSGELSFSGELNFAIGLGFNSRDGFANKCQAPHLITELKSAVRVFIGFDLRPYMAVLSKHAAKITMSGEVGVEAIAQMSKNSDTAADPANVDHSCKQCIAGEINALMTIGVKVSFGEDTWIEKSYESTIFRLKVKITDFYSTTASQLKNAVNTLIKQGVSGIIIDLRAVSNGTVEHATDALDVLVPVASDGTKALATAVDKNGEAIETFTSDADSINVSTVILVDKDTSGPAELFACDMRDFGKAKLVGTATKGNGTMQRVYQLSDGGAVKLTVAEIKPYTSDVYNGVGLTPDYLVELSSQKNNRLALLSHSEDEQYQKANSLLTSSAGADEQ